MRHYFDYRMVRSAAGIPGGDSLVAPGESKVIASNRTLNFSPAILFGARGRELSRIKANQGKSRQSSLVFFSIKARRLQSNPTWSKVIVPNRTPKFLPPTAPPSRHASAIAKVQSPA
jgi:hypothetical protein